MVWVNVVWVLLVDKMKLWLKILQDGLKLFLKFQVRTFPPSLVVVSCLPSLVLTRQRVAWRIASQRKISAGYKKMYRWWTCLEPVFRGLSHEMPHFRSSTLSQGGGLTFQTKWKFQILILNSCKSESGAQWGVLTHSSVITPLCHQTPILPVVPYFASFPLLAAWPPPLWEGLALPCSVDSLLIRSCSFP